MHDAWTINFSSEFSNLPDIVRFVSAENFSNTIQQAKQLLNQTSDAIIPSQLRDNLTFNGMVAIDLLNLADAEYQEGVENGIVTLIVEYQDAQAFR